ncbi:MAG: signal peptidase I [Candidatus Hydrogenedentes bacterium]|nr:signal peptidase I [Candidatus Hydrogenedentota bacterium]
MFTNYPDVTLSLFQRIVYSSILVVSLALIYLFTFEGMRFFLVPSSSMEPTLVPPEYLITFRQDHYERGDIVVLDDPEMQEAFLVKRIVGVAGDTLSSRGGALFIDGQYASEPYVAEPIDYMMEEFQIEEGHIFVLGDNRNESVDSHNWEADMPVASEAELRALLIARPESVPRDSVVGKVRFVYLPFNKIRVVRSYSLTNLAGK